MSKVLSGVLGAILALLLVGVLIVGLALALPKALQAGGPLKVTEEAAPNAISAMGEGRVYAKPDMAQITLGVETRAPTAKEAASQNSEAMNRVMGALSEFGISPEDIQTVDYSIYVEIDYEKEGEARIIGYVARNMVLVKMRDLEKVGDLLDAATAAGVNNIYGINFTIEDPRPVQEQARKMAVEDGRKKAQQLAEAAGVSLGELLSLDEYGIQGPYYVERAAMAPAEGIGGGGAPITPGQLEIVIQVSMRYEIAQ